MGAVNGFFRRNARLLWVFVGGFVVFFIAVQMEKSFSSPHVTYRFASECSYFLKPNPVQVPLTRSQSLRKGCQS